MVFTSDNAADITKALKDEGNYIWIGCAAHHINLIIKEGFKKVAAAAQLLKNCKAIVLAVNHSQPLLYDVRNNQNELGIPQQALMQEMITRWWSILSMLESIYKTRNAVALSLLKFDKKSVVLTSDSLSKIKEIIDLLKEIKVVTDQLETENDVSITHIIPNFKFLRDSILTHYDRDSQMIRDMKTHMKIKLDSRYSPFQTEYLT